MAPRFRLALASLALTAVAAEWLRRPEGWLVVAVATAALLAGFALRDALRQGPPWRRLLTATSLAALPIGLAWQQVQLRAIEREWPAVRERAIRAASARLAGELHSALLRADHLAEVGAASAADARRDAFSRLRGSITSSGDESGVVVLEPDGSPWAWAGRHRLMPVLSADSLTIASDGWHLTLQVRRHGAGGREAVGSILLWADSLIEDAVPSLADRFAQETGVGLRLIPPDSVVRCSDPFDYEEPTTAGLRRLFTACPVPPSQGEAKEAQLARGRAMTGWVLLAGTLLALLWAGDAIPRVVILLGPLWLVLRAPVPEGYGLGEIFSPSTYFRSALGPLTHSAGTLLLAGLVATMAGIALRRRRPRRRVWGIVLAVVLLLGVPYLVSELGRGITPPATGVPIRLWLAWQLALVFAAYSVIVLAAALLHGRDVTPVSPRLAALGAVIAGVAAIVGLATWQPGGGWPDWYPFLWTPALILVTLPTRRWAAIAGIAIVSGSAAALVTWGADLEARVEVAQRDMLGLGDEGDPLAVPLLNGVAGALDQVHPVNVAGLYTLWRNSVLGDDAYPARLALWTPEGAQQAALSLDALDLPASLVSTLVRALPRDSTRQVVRLLRVPGVYYILLVRVDHANVMSIAIGPRTRLIAPDRLDRLLDAPPAGPPLYELTLSPPAPGALVDSVRIQWRREGWSLRSERRISLPGGVRHVHAVIDMRGPAALLVRGTLAVIVDMLALALVWLMAEAGPGTAGRIARWPRAGRSFQARMAVALALFFIVPALGFTVWNEARLNAEDRRAGDILVRQSLRDATPPVAALAQAPPDLLEDGMRLLGDRLDQGLALYSGGRLLAATDPLLADLGVLPPLADPMAFQSLALNDELETTRIDQRLGDALITGYRVVEAGSPGTMGMLATMRRVTEAPLRQSQTDFALVLLLATVLGLAAALAAAQLAARMLARPVADLGRFAAAVGRGLPLPAASASPPLEFEPVFAAIERMSADVRASQEALDVARRRTAAVLANVATGVVALDGASRVLVANARAEALLGHPLEAGQDFAAQVKEGWQPLRDAVRTFLAAPQHAATVVELESAGRRIRLQLASLGGGGAVLAFDDVTEVARAERVLAWGEVARQVAHEVKNPLTPIRLGVQHLRRVFEAGDAGFANVLGETSDRILAEIDRLDTIARAFSRFAAPADQAPVLETVELATIAREVAGLYAIGGGTVAVEATGAASARVEARRDEVREVLVNLVENARAAGARRIELEVGPGSIAVRDDGRGISEALLGRIFEPRFSTTTSGAGLGLAIVRRLVEGWGAEVEVTSTEGKGTTVTVRW
jgi:two-component system nitrogen regulation sensor histidine kinase NtrY